MASHRKRDLQTLIALFARYEISQRAIAQRLGVAETKVSAWWRMRVPIPARHHMTLQRWAADLEAGPPQSLPSPFQPLSSKLSLTFGSIS
jgi:transcriptional regulator with XRE-family HTH domain